MSKISFSSEGYVLAGNLFKAQQPDSLAFLFIQGWTGHQNVKAAQRLTGMGYTTMTYDMRGNGESEGDLAAFSRADFVADAVMAYDYLKDQVGKETNVVVVGSSFGSYCAVLLTVERKVHGLSLRVPSSYPDEGFNAPQLPHAGSEALHEWRKKALHYSENRAFNALHEFQGKVQIIEAGADEQVARQAVQNYVDAVEGRQSLNYAVMENAPHSLVTAELQGEYEGLLIGWVKLLSSSV
jgi:esterase/lipase